MRRGIALLMAVLLMCGVPLSASAEAPPQTVSSHSIVLYEPESGRVLYEKDADTPRPMASTTKLMTALIASEHLEADSTVTVPAAAVLVEGSSMGLRGGDVLTVRDLLAGLLLSSGNDAANALALLVSGSLPKFASLMNDKAAELGMTNTVFVTPSGLDEGDHHSTARDMALLGAAVLQVPLLAELCLSKTATVHINGTAVTISNHNRLLHLYADAVGLKTGYTKKSGKCLVSAATRDGVTLVVASLNGGDYWNDHMALYEYGFSCTESAVLPLPELPFVAVAGGTAERVSLRATAPRVVLVDGEKETLTCEWELPAFVWATVRENEPIGVLRYRTQERLIAEVPLVAANAVDERPAIPFAEIWRRQLARLFVALTR